MTPEALHNRRPPTPPVTEEEINSEAELLKSPDLLARCRAGERSSRGREKNRCWLRSFRATRGLVRLQSCVSPCQGLNIGVVKKTDMIDVSYKSSDPQLAFGVLDKLSGSIHGEAPLVHRPLGSYDFFAKETEKYKRALADSETRLAGFGRTEGVVAPDVQRTDMAQQAMNSAAAFHHALQAIAADEERIRDEKAQMKATPSRSSTLQVSTTADVLLQQLQTNLLAARIKKTQLALKYDSSYPLVQEADQEIAQTEAAIADAQKTQYINQTTDRDPTYEFLRQDVAKTEADLASQKATASAVKQSIQGLQEQMVSLDQKAVKQADLLREAKADEANYLLYLSKREQERTSDALDQKRIGNVAIAAPPMLPILPAYSALLVMVVGCFLAVFFSVGFAFVMDYLDSSFRTPTEVFETLKIPVLAFMPKQST